jgi:nicotinamidase-related amidase
MIETETLANQRAGNLGRIFMKRYLIAAAAAAAVAALALPAQAGDIIQEWANVKAPAVLPLKAVTVDPKTTALLMLDFIKPNCPNRPRCMASLPAAKKLLDEARAKNVLVVYTTSGMANADAILPEVAPSGKESLVRVVSVDKFTGTDLEKMLKDKGIQTVIIGGTAAHGAVLYAGSAAAVKGFKVLAPVDLMSSEDLYYEQATAWLLAKGTGGIGPKVTLTRSTMIKFQ